MAKEERLNKIIEEAEKGELKLLRQRCKEGAISEGDYYIAHILTIGLKQIRELLIQVRDKL